MEKRTRRETDQHPLWLEQVEALEGFGPSSRFFVFGMKGNDIVTVDRHKVQPEAWRWIRRNTFDNREREGVHYSAIFGGFRLYWWDDEGIYLPYPNPEKEQKRG